MQRSFRKEDQNWNKTHAKEGMEEDRGCSCRENKMVGDRGGKYVGKGSAGKSIEDQAEDMHVGRWV